MHSCRVSFSFFFFSFLLRSWILESVIHDEPLTY
jgi:hypothetical protein